MDQTTDIQASEELTLPGNHAAASADGLVVDNANDNAGQEEGFEIVLKDDEKPKQDPATNAEFARRRIERKRQRELEQQRVPEWVHQVAGLLKQVWLEA